MPTQIAGFVLRAESRSKTALFYKALGLNAREHEHGGPFHFEVTPTATDMVLEIYDKSTHYQKDTVMLYVDSFDVILATLKDLGVINDYTMSYRGSVWYGHLTDPDGRHVMLMEKK